MSRIRIRIRIRMGIGRLREKSESSSGPQTKVLLKKTNSICIRVISFFFLFYFLSCVLTFLQEISEGDHIICIQYHPQIHLVYFSPKYFPITCHSPPTFSLSPFLSSSAFNSNLKSSWTSIPKMNMDMKKIRKEHPVAKLNSNLTIILHFTQAHMIKNENFFLSSNASLKLCKLSVFAFLPCSSSSISSSRSSWTWTHYGHRVTLKLRRQLFQLWS